jgi:hypothetical protein
VDLDEMISVMVEVEQRRRGPYVEDVYLVEGEYEDHWLAIGRFLERLECAEGYSDEEWRKLKEQSAAYRVRNGWIYRRREEGRDQELVMSDSRRLLYLEALHDDLGHRGRDKMYRRVKERCWWPGMEKDVREYVKTCEACQRRKLTTEVEEQHHTITRGIFQRVHFDCVHIKQGAQLYFVVTWDNLSGWPEARAVKKLTSKAVVKFLWEDLISPFRVFFEAVVDGGSEFEGEMKEALEGYGIEVKVISPHHPEANGWAERGHPSLVDAMVKICKDSQDWDRYLPGALFTDRIPAQRMSGMSPFQFVMMAEPILPLDLKEEMWLVVEWKKVKTRADLIAARVLLMEQNESAVARAVTKLEESRKKSIAYANKKNAHRLWQPLEPGAWVLAQNMRRKDLEGGKFAEWWLGPFIVNRRLTKGSYLLEEPGSGVIWRKPFAAKRLRQFYPRGRYVRELEAEETSGSESEEEDDGSSVDEQDEEEAVEIVRTGTSANSSSVRSTSSSQATRTQLPSTVSSQNPTSVPSTESTEEEEEDRGRMRLRDSRLLRPPGWLSNF